MAKGTTRIPKTFGSRFVFNALAVLVERPIMNLLSGLEAAGALAMFHGMVSGFPDFSNFIFKTITKLVWTPPSEWQQFVSTYVAKMTGSAGWFEKLKTSSVDLMGKALAQEIGHAFLSPMLNLILPERPAPGAEPYHFFARLDWGRAGAERYLSTNLQFQMNAWLLHLIGDTVSFGSLKSLKDLPNAISWSYGLGWLSWLVMGTPFRAAISLPFEWELNKTYRTTLLNASQYIDAFLNNYISPEDFYEKMAWLGYCNHYIDILTHSKLVRISEGDIKDLITMGYVDPPKEGEDLVEWYRKYNWEFLATELLINRYSADYWKKTVDEAIRQFIDGGMSEADLRHYLSLANISGEDQTTILAYAKLKRRANTIPSDSLIKKAYTDGIISYEEAYSWLLRKGYDSIFAKAYLYTEGKRTPDSLIKRAFQLGMISKEEAIQRLLAHGYEEVMAEAYLYTKEKPTPASLVKKALELGMISHDEALERLQALGWEQLFAEAYLREKEEEKAAELEEPWLPPTTLIKNAYKYNMISRDEALELLLQKGYTEKWANIELDLIDIKA